MKADYLKYWHIVRRWALVTYELTGPELDLLLFLRTERYFTKKQYRKSEFALPWNKKRFHSLIDRGWIQEFRPHVGGVAARYQVSLNATRMMSKMYRILDGKEEMSEMSAKNPIFKDKVCFTDRMYQEQIRDMNKATRRRRPRIRRSG
jgi:hypothetical protein